jgi:hypothetical protein
MGRKVGKQIGDRLESDGLYWGDAGSSFEPLYVADQIFLVKSRKVVGPLGIGVRGGRDAGARGSERQRQS